MKRNLFKELKEGFDALAGEHEGKLTLRTHVIDAKTVPVVGPSELISLRERLNISRAVFASYLRTNIRTVENWEQGRASPNAQATLLIRLVQKYPDMWQRLQGI
ncbi:MAG: transcriptional regulator [bacterium]|nr:transcriptional regulator [bacterium]